MFLPLELLEVLLLGIKVVDAPNAVVVAIEGGENCWTEWEHTWREGLLLTLSTTNTNTREHLKRGLATHSTGTTNTNTNTRKPLNCQCHCQCQGLKIVTWIDMNWQLTDNSTQDTVIVMCWIVLEDWQASGEGVGIFQSIQNAQKWPQTRGRP